MCGLRSCARGLHAPVQADGDSQPWAQPQLRLPLDRLMHQRQPGGVPDSPLDLSAIRGEVPRTDRGEGKLEAARQLVEAHMLSADSSALQSPVQSTRVTAEVGMGAV